MGLVSYLASRPQVFRVAPFHKTKLLNAVASAITQSATITDTPLADAGLDGSGEVIQVTCVHLPLKSLGKCRVSTFPGLASNSAVRSLACTEGLCTRLTMVRKCVLWQSIDAARCPVTTRSNFMLNVEAEGQHSDRCAVRVC